MLAQADIPLCLMAWLITLAACGIVFVLGALALGFIALIGATNGVTEDG